MSKSAELTAGLIPDHDAAMALEEGRMSRLSLATGITMQTEMSVEPVGIVKDPDLPNLLFFGEYFKGMVVASYAHKYIQYDDLKRLLHYMKTNRLKIKDYFYRKIESNYAETRSYAELRLKQLEGVDNATAMDPSTVEAALELNRFVYLNQEALRKLIQKHDKLFPKSRMRDAWEWKLDFGLIKRIIDVVLRSAAAKIRLKDRAQPSFRESNTNISFTKMFENVSLDRSSFARPSNTTTMTNPLIAGAHHEQYAVSAPSQSSKEKPGVQLTNQEDSFVRDSRKYWVTLHDLVEVCAVLSENLQAYVFGDQKSPWTPISSVYIDSKDRCCYKTRLAKDDGARLVRLRTYNNNLDTVYVERKIHYDKVKSPGKESSKDRFPIEQDFVLPLLRGQKLEVPPKHKSLAKEITTMVREEGLYPTVRVECDRIAFQPKEHDHIRVSIDINLRWLQEQTTQSEWRTPEKRMDDKDKVSFPYAVVEVKLRDPYIDNPPEWLHKLQQSNLMHEDKKFSKYLHGAYIFAPKTLQLQRPVWFARLRHLTYNMPKSAFLDDDDDDDDDEGNRGRNTKRQDDDNSQLTKKLPARDKGHDSASHWLAELLGIKAAVDDNGKPIKIEPKVFFANERTFLAWFSCAMFVSSIGVSLTAASPTSFVAGGCLLFIGAIIVWYASMTFLQRINSLLTKRSAGYHDKFGPTILGLTVVCVFWFAFLYSSLSGGATTK